MRRLYQCSKFFSRSSYIVNRRLTSYYPVDIISYNQWGRKRADIIEKKLRINRFVSIGSREERGFFSREQYKQIIVGKFQMNYR